MTVAQKHPAAEPPATYEGGYYGWLTQQGALLKAGRNARADWTIIAETLRDLSQRNTVAEFLDDSGSLRAKMPEVLIRAYVKARREAADETGLPERAFLSDCPYTFDELMTRDIPWPPQD